MAKTITLEVQVPSWAKWIAQDRNGSWQIFAGPPAAKERWWDADGHQSEILVRGYKVNPNWKRTLRKI